MTKNTRKYSITILTIVSTTLGLGVLLPLFAMLGSEEQILRLKYVVPVYILILVSIVVVLRRVKKKLDLDEWMSPLVFIYMIASIVIGSISIWSLMNSL